ncbi:Leucine carboxyl methyltransferase 2 [Dimargaris xerosporica]|nr:Leucine carboxyl methyltransferase 2 [Dimargaris xerosporica]
MQIFLLLLALALLGCGYAIPPLAEHTVLFRTLRLTVTGGRLGPYNRASNYSADTWSLPLGQAFNMTDAQWTKKPSPPRLVAGATLVNATDDQNLDYLWSTGGRVPEDADTENDLMQYSVRNDDWKTVQYSVEYPRLYGSSATFAPAIGSVVYFGGTIISPGTVIDRNGPNNTTSTLVKDSVDSAATLIFQPKKQAQYFVDASNDTPAPRYKHLATMINGTHLAIIGGKFAQGFRSVDEAHLLDAKTKQWSTRKVEGAWFSSLHSATAVTYHRRIVVYGGLINDDIEINNQLLTIDTTRSVWQWERVSFENLPPARFDYAAVLLGKYLMVVGGETEVGYSESTYGLDLEANKTISYFNLTEALNMPRSAYDYSLYESGSDPHLNSQSSTTLKAILLGTLIPAFVGSVAFVIWWFKSRKSGRMTTDPWTMQPVGK